MPFFVSVGPPSQSCFRKTFFTLIFLCGVDLWRAVVPPPILSTQSNLRGFSPPRGGGVNLTPQFPRRPDPPPICFPLHSAIRADGVDPSFLFAPAAPTPPGPRRAPEADLHRGRRHPAGGQATRGVHHPSGPRPRGPSLVSPRPLFLPPPSWVVVVTCRSKYRPLINSRGPYPRGPLRPSAPDTPPSLLGRAWDLL